MTHRERVQAALAFERPDALPCHESPWEQTLAAWRTQGMPAGVVLEDHFGFDLAFMYLDTSPRFEQRIIERDGGTITYADRYGYTIRKADGVNATLDFLDHRTKDHAAWGETRAGMVLDANAPARIDDASYFGHFDPYPTWTEAGEKYRRLYAAGRYMLFTFYGPWEATWRHRGLQNLLVDVATESDWVQEMADVYEDLVIDVLRHCLDLGMKPDGVFVPEDLGCSTGPLMAPALWCRVFQPAVSRLGDFLREHGIDFWLHCDGAVDLLTDHFVESGVQVLNPLEVKAGMDAVALRRRYGKRLAFFGGIDATKMFGPQDALQRELERKVPLAWDGGYIMHSDHSCPPEVSYARYCWMLATAREIFYAG